ncbi:hypothetical protein [Streptomyces sp. NPDC057694]|uniref:hypothetical protein n=1 Tax=Streptomyces sp. NPDC057694 TaxID=3346216 RepID=UPI0036D1761A
MAACSARKLLLHHADDVATAGLCTVLDVLSYDRARGTTEADSMVFLARLDAEPGQRLP